MIKKLLLGTNNSAKVAHMKQFLSDLNIEIVTPQEVGITEEPEETGKTLEENARLKADFYFGKSGLPTIADDAGFEIPALDNFPGVYSKRFAGHEMTDEEIIFGILKKMKDLTGEQRKGDFKIVIALKLSDSEVHITSGQISGTVADQPLDRRMERFPYRSLLYVDQLDKWFMDVTEEEENSIGYRKGAVEQLKPFIQNYS